MVETKKSLWRVIFSKKMFLVLMMGFSSGLPLLLIGGTLKAWLKQSEIDLATIGFFGLTGLPYTFKFLWAPLMDRYAIAYDLLGRRRGWLLLCQIILALGIAALAFTDPGTQLKQLAFLSLLIGFFSASQDIVVDAYRREYLSDEELGLGSSLYINGYRLAMYVAGSIALILAGTLGWSTTYLLMALMMGMGVLTTLFAPNPALDSPAPVSLQEAVIGPFLEFFKRPGALWVLAFVLLYKMGDTMADAMINPFYLDIGFTTVQVGAIAKTLGLAGTLAGAVLGGIIILRFGMIKSLWLFGILQAVSTAGFSFLAISGASVSVLSAVILFETFTSGMGTSAYSGFMAAQTNKQFTATQYALLTSLMGIPRVIFGSFSGVLAQSFGWVIFFIFCTALAIPGLLLILKVTKSKPQN